ncbi:hypothetical protein [Mangrovibacillus cuniculi]|uniref:DUF2268 domain-containing protein n=1 Tax=Mangrovibacillus cuniculi TaxID=2593652 RepID=A0A7S8HEV2_9BACI|nr:hypothetical protein [Mangrovibacillus cuniculi]QPC45861.1 hypothetical protein G8O30_02255 [Mangrovibacillus cuniculi]
MDQIEIINLVPRFLKFYQEAKAEEIDREKRWELWKEHYNFAAVPPGEEGKKKARQLLDNAWNQYRERIRYLENWESDVRSVELYLSKVKSLLGYQEPINLVVVYFVGGFEGNPFVAPYDQERLALCLPVECNNTTIILSHELTHIVHASTANFSTKWERSIASTILQEGLAMHVSKQLVPGKEEESYTEFTKGWLASCKASREEIFKGILPYLEDSSSETVFRFTMGLGTTNHEREAYFVGWEMVNYLLGRGTTLEEIACIREDKMINYVRNIHKKMLIL